MSYRRLCKSLLTLGLLFSWISPLLAQNNRLMRWGLIVWRTTDIETPWDGTHKGKPVQQGAYVYKWFLEDIHGDRKTGTGTVTLIR